MNLSIGYADRIKSLSTVQSEYEEMSQNSVIFIQAAMFGILNFVKWRLLFGK